jgi:hypothetical protein
MNVRTLSLLCAVACQYEAPLDPNAPALLGAMEGEIVFGGAGELGPAYVILYDAANPGPPAGTGGPITFTAVAPDAFSGDDAGIDAAPFSLTRLDPGAYLVNGLVDVDGNFNPLVTALAGATCGDWVGAHLTDLVTQQQAPVTVSAGEQTDDVTVLIGQQMPIERPVFEIVGGGASFDISDVRDQLAVPLFRLRTTELELAEGDPPFSAEIPLVLGPTCTPAPDPATCSGLPVCTCASVDPCGTAQYLQFVDADADGLADPNPDPTLAAGGVLDAWPHVFLESLADLGEFEVEGEVYEERWVTQAFPLLGEIATIAATNSIPPAQAAGILAPAGVPVPSYELSVTFVPVFLHFHAGGAIPSPNGPYDVVDLRDPATSADGFPAGAFQLTVISFTGQTWTLPNEAALSLPTQGAVVTLAP